MRHEVFEKVFVYLILLNTVLMATDFHSLGRHAYYGHTYLLWIYLTLPLTLTLTLTLPLTSAHMGEAHKQVLSIANMAFVIAFACEVSLKLVGAPRRTPSRTHPHPLARTPHLS